MQDIRDIYRNVYLSKDDELLTKIMREGFAQKKWATFS
jgi:hypothetical protein